MNDTQKQARTIKSMDKLSITDKKRKAQNSKGKNEGVKELNRMRVLQIYM